MSETENWKRISGLAGLEQAQRVMLVPENDEDPHIVWLGHASFLLCWHGQKILIDPVFKKWIGFYKRYVPISDLSSIRKIDAVLVTHAHMDHLDTRWIEALDAGAIIVPRKKWSDSLGERNESDSFHLEWVRKRSSEVCE